MLTGRPARPVPSAEPRNTDLADAQLATIIIVAIGAALVGLIAATGLPEGWGRPGSPVLQSAAIAGSVLLLVSFAAVLAKRAGRPGKQGFRAHVWLAGAGTALVVVHSTGTLLKFPSLLLLALAAMIALGVWSRLIGSRRMANTFGGKMAGFSKPDAAVRERLAALIATKQALLTTIEPTAKEALFSLTPKHWIATPIPAFAYHRAVTEEHRLIGTRASVTPAQAYWRLLHRLLAWGFVAGLLIHVVTVTVFAGYVADGRVVYWWRLAEWGG